MSYRYRSFAHAGILAAVLAVTAGVQTAGADGSVHAPDNIPGTLKVDAEGLIDTIASTPGLVLIDSRIAMDRKQGYIEGSVSLPDTDTDCDTLSLVIADLNRPVLFYCNGPKCGRSVKAIHKAQACGYSKLYWFRGGFEEWTEKGYPFLKE